MEFHQILMALSLLHTYIAIPLLLPFKKLVLVLMLSKAWRNSQSKAVWVITVAHAEKSWAKNQNKFERPWRNIDILENKRILFNSSFLFEFLPLSGFWISLVMLLVSSIFWRWFFSVFVVNFANLLSDSSKFTCRTPFWILFSITSVFLIDISSSTIYRHFEMFFLSF